MQGLVLFAVAPAAPRRLLGGDLDVGVADALDEGLFGPEDLLDEDLRRMERRAGVVPEVEPAVEGLFHRLDDGGAVASAAFREQRSCRRDGGVGEVEGEGALGIEDDGFARGVDVALGLVDGGVQRLVAVEVGTVDAGAEHLVVRLDLLEGIARFLFGHGCPFRLRSREGGRRGGGLEGKRRSAGNRIVVSNLVYLADLICGVGNVAG